MNEASQSGKTLLPVLFLHELLLYLTILERKRTFLHHRLEYCSKANRKRKSHEKVNQHLESTLEFLLNAKGHPHILTAQDAFSSPLVCRRKGKMTSTKAVRVAQEHFPHSLLLPSLWCSSRLLV